MPIEGIDISLPYVGTIKWKPDREQQKAAWNLYVELATRITAVPIERGLEGDRGSPRQAMTSLYQVLQDAREVLKAAGPSIAKGPHSLGPLTIRILNQGVRPLLDRYHAPLLIHESLCPPDVHPLIHEQKWPPIEDFWEEAEKTQAEIREFQDALEVMASIHPAAGAS